MEQIKEIASYKKHLPNIITYLRIFLVIVIIILGALSFYFNDSINKDEKSFLFLKPNTSLYLWITILVVFFIAAITDFFDGYLARRFKTISTKGKILDPIADKMLTITLLIILSSFRIIYIWLTLLLIMREIIINSFRLVYSSKNIIIQAKWHGKLKTIMLFIGILFAGFVYPSKIEITNEQLVLFINSSVLLLACVFSYFSLFRYMYSFRKKPRSKPINNT